MFSWYSQRPLHASWLIAVVCFGITIGLIGAPHANGVVSGISWLVVACVLLGGGWIRRSRYSVVPLLLAGVLIGLVRGDVYQRQLAPYDDYIGTTVSVRGIVKDDSDVGKQGEVVLRLGDIEIDRAEVGGAIWVSVDGKADIKRGDRVTVNGELSEGFGSFAASMHRAEFVRIERPMPGSVALTIRDWFAGGVRQAIPEPEASLGVGYVVGQRRSLPEDLDASLRAAGLTHVVVASGYNLTILVSVARRLFGKVSKFLAGFFSGGLTVAFMAVTGMSPSMSRAGLVTGLGLLAWYYGRRFHPVVLLLLAAAITLLINPAYAQNDLGWQLSFASFAGVLIVGPLLQSYFFGEEKPGVMRQVLFETLSAWVCTVPLIVLAFGQFSNVAILANILVLPLIPLAMLLTFVAGSMTLIVPALATIAGFPAFLLLGYMTKTSMFLGNVSWAQTALAVPWYVVVLYYAALLVFLAYIWRATRFDFMDRAALE